MATMMLRSRGIIRIRMPAISATMGCKCAILMVMMDSPVGRQFAKTARRSSSLYLSLDPGEIGDGARGFANLIEKSQAVFTQRFVLNIDGDLVEESIDAGSKPGHRSHGGFEILPGDGGQGLLLCNTDGLGERLFLGQLIALRIRRAGILAVVLFLLDPDDVGRALVAGEQVLAIVAVEKFSQRFDAPHDHQQIVLAFQ